MILQVALDTPLRRVFDYLPPAKDRPSEERRGSACASRCPLAVNGLIGILVGIVSESTLPSGKLRAAHEILDEEPVYDPVTFDLLRWAADYYHHPIGEVYAAALPASLRKGLPVAINTEHSASPTRATGTSPAELEARTATACAARLAGRSRRGYGR